MSVNEFLTENGLRQMVNYNNMTVAIVDNDDKVVATMALADMTEPAEAAIAILKEKLNL